ncbi:cell cycle transcriptional regulator TrcR [Rickettsiales bacterium LUAb2]
MSNVLMKTAVAIWLIENTALTFQQIADFCDLHILRVEALANDDTTKNHGLDPTIYGELDKEEIARCEKDPSAKLQPKNNSYYNALKSNNASSQSKFQKQNKPNVVLWLIQNYPELSNYQIAKLVAATPNVVKNIREKKYRNYPNLKPKNPISAGYCTEEEVVAALAKKSSTKISE